VNPNPPTVSVVLPTYNGSRFIRESLDSCLAQTYTDWEMIIVDDCSTDETPAIISAYVALDARIRSVRNPTNLRLPRSLNVGFATARGKYFTWTSDDNRYRPHALRTMAYVLDHNPDYDLVYSDYSAIDDDGAFLAHRHVWPIETLCYANCVGPSFMYRRIVHETLRGYDESKPLVEDYDFWLRAARSFRFKQLLIDLYEYRHHRKSLSTQHTQAIQTLHRAELREILRDSPWLSRAERARACVHLARASLARGQAWEAAHDLWLGCTFAPLAVGGNIVGRAYRRVIGRSLSS
jgi:glycosyltransferase involved in cell wall biosynthesis